VNDDELKNVMNSFYNICKHSIPSQRIVQINTPFRILLTGRDNPGIEDAVVKFNVNGFSQVAGHVVNLNTVSLSDTCAKISVSKILFAAIGGVREDCVSHGTRVSIEDAGPAKREPHTMRLILILRQSVIDPAIIVSGPDAGPSVVSGIITRQRIIHVQVCDVCDMNTFQISHKTLQLERLDHGLPFQDRAPSINPPMTRTIAISTSVNPSDFLFIVMLSIPSGTTL
jgi:hypothetical protein